MTSNVIELHNVTKRYKERIALNGVNLQIPTGITGLLGPNGSGKSTLIKSLLGLVKVDQGSRSVLGFPLPDRLRDVRDHVGYLPEDDCFFAGLTGIEALHVMAQLSGLPSREALRRSHEIMDYSDIGGERYRNVETYSTGMRQKLKFAQAMVHDPELLILDEPTTGLDPIQRSGMLRRIKNLAIQHGKSILLSTHILHDVKEICDHVVILSQGTVRVVDRLANLSQPAESGIQIQVVTNPNLLVEQLSRDGVAASIIDNGSIWAKGSFEDNCDVIWNAARSCNVTISGLMPALHSLEKIFIDAVKEATNATA